MKFKLLATTFAFALAMPAAADVLVDNVEGITFDEDGKIKRFNALVIDDDGKVAQILSSKDKKPQTDYRENGRGAVMIPGLIDAHAHVMGIGIGALTLDLSETNSLEEALDKIRRFAAENESRPWILGRGWNQEKWALADFQRRPNSTARSPTGQFICSAWTAMPAGRTASPCRLLASVQKRRVRKVAAWSGWRDRSSPRACSSMPQKN